MKSVNKIEIPGHDDESFRAFVISDPSAALKLFMDAAVGVAQVNACVIHEIHDCDGKPTQWTEHSTLHGLVFEEVYSEGAYEGAGEHMEKVFALKDTNGEALAYYRFVGYYSSWDEGQWDDDFTVVRPVQKLVTVYE